MEYIAIVFQKRGQAPGRQKKLEHHKTYNKTVMNKQNTHKKLPIVSPVVTNLPQVSLSFSRGREEKKGPGNEVQSSLD